MWHFATCYVWYISEPGCMVEKMKCVCRNFPRATGKAKHSCLLYLLRPEGKTGFPELARWVTMWAGKCGLNNEGTTAFICFSLLTFILQQAQRFYRSSSCRIYSCVFSSYFNTVLQTLRHLQKHCSFHIEDIIEHSFIFLVWKRSWPCFSLCFIFLFKRVESWWNWL